MALYNLKLYVTYPGPDGGEKSFHAIHEGSKTCDPEKIKQRLISTMGRLRDCDPAKVHVFVDNAPLTPAEKAIRNKALSGGPVLKRSEPPKPL